MTRIEGREEEIVIHNVYNPNEKRGDLRHKEGRYEGFTTSSALPLLESALERYHEKEQLVLGDFNMHHSKWDGENYRSSRNSSSNQTDFMIEMIERWGLDLCLEQGRVTRLPLDHRSNQGSVE